MSSSAALFGGVNAGAAGSRNLVEFRAGKLNLEGRWVHPDARKGLLYVYQSEDSLIHFCWKERKSGATVEDDFIIFPDDVEFKRVPQCTSGRVYVLRFRSSTRRFFFWMQEPRTERDDELCRKVNESLNRPPTARGSAAAASSALAALGDGSDLNSVLGGMSQADLMSLLSMGIGGGGGGLGQSLRPASTGSQPDSEPPSRVQSSPGGRPAASAATAATSAVRPTTALAGSGAGQFQLADLQTILSSIGGGADAGATLDAAQPELVDVLSPEQLRSLLAEPAVQTRLLPHLPEGTELPQSAAELDASVRSPQFRQAVAAFGAVFQTGQLGAVLGTQFGLGEAAVLAAHSGDLVAFATALQQQQAVEERDASEALAAPEEKMDES